MLPTTDMPSAEFHFENPLSELDLTLAWTVLLKDYAGSSNVSFFLTGSAGREGLPHIASTVNLVIDEKATLTHLSRQIERQVSVNLDSIVASQDSSFQTHLSISYPENEILKDSHSSTEHGATVSDRHSFPKTRIDLTINCVVLEQGKNVTVTITPATTAVISRAQTFRVLQQFEQVLQQTQQPALRNELVYSIRTASNIGIRDMWNWNRHVPKNGMRTALGIFSDRAKELPNSLAVNAWDGDLTYQELDDLSTVLSSRLVHAGAQQGQIVPLCFEKTKWTLVAVLAVIKAGATFVLLDENLPRERLRQLSCVIAQEPILALTSVAQLHRAKAFASAIIIVNYNLLDIEKIPEDTYVGSRLVEPSDLIYVVFTSGTTTGTPKAVMIQHSNVCFMVASMGPLANITSSSRILALASFAFDISLGQMFLSLLSGACLCIPSSWECRNDVACVIDKYQITYAQMTPSVSKMLQPSETPTLEVLELCGEPCSEDALAKWRGTRTRIMNTYGPAECTPTSVANEDVLHSPRASIIGKALGACWVMDPIYRDRLTPVGGIGELVLEGPQIGLGYLHDQTSTAASFFEDPEWLLNGLPDISVGRKGRLYRTGDLIRYTNEGLIEYIGRRDSQVKIRGQRVELGELAAHLQELIPSPLQWCPEVVQLRNSAEVLIVFIVSPVGGRSNSVDILQPIIDRVDRELKTRLHSMMVPGAYACIKEIPLSMTGKTDHRRLKQIALSLSEDQLLFPQTRSVTSQNSVSRANEKAYTSTNGNSDYHGNDNLVANSDTVDGKLDAMKLLWSDLFNRKLEIILPSDNFFRLGGDSLTAIKLVGAAARQGIQIDSATIFRHPQLSEIANRCRLTVSSTVIPLKRFSLLKNMQVLPELARICETCIDNIEDAYPCTPMQEGLIISGSSRRATYTGRGFLRLPDHIDLERLARAWQQVTIIHPILRTRIIYTTSSGLLQVTLKHSQLYSRENVANLADYLKEDRTMKMGLGTQLCRWGIVREATTAYFVLTMHHAIYDGWTLQRIGSEVYRAYQGVRIVPAIGFNIYIKHLATQSQNLAQDFWARQFTEPEKTTVFPAVPNSVQEPIADSIVSKTFKLPENKNCGVSIPSLLRAAWALLVSELSGSDDVTFGITVSGRNVPITGVEDLLSPTISTIPVRVKLDRAETVSSFVTRIQDEVLESMPFETMGLQNIRKINSDTRERSKFQTLFIVHPPNAPSLETSTDTSLAELELKSMLETLDISTSLSEFNEYALMVLIAQKEDSMLVEASFDSRVLVNAQVDLLLDQFAHTAREIGCQDNLERRLGNLDFASDSDVDTVWKWNSGRIQGSQDCIHDLIAKTIRLQPEAQAICAWDGNLTYAELDKLSSLLAKALASKEVKRGTLVPICMEKSMWTTVAILGILKTGAGFIAMDVRQQPEQRLRTIVEESKANWVVTAGPAINLAHKISKGVIVCGHDWDDKNFQFETSPVTSVSSPSDPAFVVFSSGSTGVPKGIIITHENFCTTIRYHEHELQLSRNSRIYDYASYSFDIAVHNALMALAFGGTLCVPSEFDRENDIEGSLERLGANWADLTPSVARLIDPTAVPSLKNLILSGETVGKDLVVQWAPRVTLINGYGPAECQICTIQGRLHNPDDAANIGRGVGCSTWIIVPERGNLAPIGSVGELCIEGPIVSPGYLNASGESFMQNPSWLLTGSTTIPGRQGVVYRTGDLARYQPDGTIVYIGRATAQTKVNGQRVELGEIEFHIRRALSIIRDVVVDMVSFGGISSICAFLLHHDTGIKLQPNESDNTANQFIILTSAPAGLESKLKASLPSYMIPNVFFRISHLPLTTTRKVDRRKLKAAADCFSRDEILSLYTEDTVAEELDLDKKQQRMMYIWSQVLKLESSKINLSSDFFQLGGDSISAMRLVKFSRQQRLFFTVADVFRSSQFAKLCGIASECTEHEDHSKNHLGKMQPFSLLPGEDREALIISAADSCKVNPSDILDIYPCTPFQEGVFALTASDISAYVQHTELKLNDKVDFDRVIKAWNSIIASNSVLRTRIIQSEKGSLVQVVIRGEQEWQWYSSAKEYLADAVKKPMWSGNPLSRFGLIRNVSETSTGFTIVWSIHHALYDSWTMSLILRQVSKHYHGQDDKKSGPDYSAFVQFIHGQRAQSEAWWLSNLNGASNAAVFPKIPLTRERAKSSSVKRKDIASPNRLPPGYTTAVLLRATWAILMARHTGGESVLFGEMRLGRNVPIRGIELMRGPTIAPVPVLMRMDRRQTIGTLLDSARESSIEMQGFDHLGLQNIARISEDTRAACNFQTLLVIQEDEDAMVPDDLIFEIDSTIDDIRNFNSWGLMIVFHQNSKGLVAEALYRESAASGDLVKFLLQQTDSIFQTLCTSPMSTPLQNLDLPNQGDLSKIWNWNCDAPETIDEFVHDLIAKQARQNPNKIAVLAHDGQMTYKELDDFSTNLASQLIFRGIGTGCFVPLCFEKCLMVPVAMLAVTKTGAAFSVMDVTYSESRLKTISTALEAVIVLSSSALLNLAKHLADDVFVVDYTSCNTICSQGKALLQQSAPRNTNQIMYVCYTSGSTGVPKGVMVSHKNIASATTAQTRELEFTPDDRVYDFSSHAFDANIWHTFNALVVGACLCIPSYEDRVSNLAGSISSFYTTALFLTPSVARTIDPRETPTVKRLYLGGEAVTPLDVSMWKDHVELWGAYGPTEATPLSVFTRLLTPESASNIGRGSGVIPWVCNPNNHNELVAIGSVGEMCLEGPLVTLGYRNLPERTAAVFIENPRFLVQGSNTRQGRHGRLYKTGDLVRYAFNGTIEYMGRADTQIKLRGQRVEFGEIEYHLKNVLLDVSWIVCEVVSHPLSGRPALVAFCVPCSTEKGLDMFEARKYLNERLPPYMIPEAFLTICEIPKNSSGKIDHQRLKILGPELLQLSASTGAEEAFEHQYGPLTEVENLLKSLWVTVLGQNITIHPDSDFFEVGADSIVAMKLLNLVRKHDLSLSMKDIMQHSRLSLMASSINKIRIPSDNPASFSLVDQTQLSQMLEKAAAVCGVSADCILDTYPCTPLQIELFALTMKQPQAYIKRSVFEVPTHVNSKKLLKAWDTVISINAILRTRFVNVEGSGLLQVVLKDHQWESCESLNTYLTTSPANADLGKELSRVAAISDKSGPKIVWTIHHALYDGWSLHIIENQLRDAYEDRVLRSPPEFSVFVRHLLQKDLEKSRDFWRARLAGCASTTIYPRLPSKSYQVKPSKTFKRTLQVNIEPGTKLQATIHAAWALVVSKLSAEDDTVFAATLPGRDVSIRDVELIVGPTITPVPIRIQIGNVLQPISELLGKIEQDAIAMASFQHIGTKNIELINNDTRAACKFQTLLVVMPDNAIHESNVISTSTYEVVGTEHEVFHTFGLVLFFTPTHYGLDLEVIFDPVLLAQREVERLSGRLESVISLVGQSRTNGLLISDIECLSKEDLDDITAWNSMVPPTSSLLLHDIILDRIQQNMEKAAIDAWDCTISYSQLEIFSRRIKERLHKIGVGRGAIVPIISSKSGYIPVAALSILRTGATFLPIDDSLPLNRIKQIVEQVQSDVVLAAHSSKDIVASLEMTALFIEECLNETDSSFLHHSNGYSPVKPDDVACILFTSGSTGTPKGVMQTHEALSTAVIHQAAASGFNKGTRAFEFASYSFDVSWNMIFKVLATGGTLCVPSKEERLNDLVGALNRSAATLTELTASVARLINPKKLNTLETLILSGEFVDLREFENWKPGVRLIVCYGPSECTSVSTMNPGIRDESNKDGIGRGIACITWIVDPQNHRRLMPVSAVGEVLIEGPILGKGYYKNEKLTKASYVSDLPWQEAWNKQTYDQSRIAFKTGDLARYDSNGNLHFVSRKDTQIKLYGQRIELEEVQFHVRKMMGDFPGPVIACAITEPTTGNEQLAVFLSCEKVQLDALCTLTVPTLAEKAALENLDDKLRSVLPRYMIPAVYFFITAVPHTTNGKADHKKLIELATHCHQDQIYRGRNNRKMVRRNPATAVEINMQRLWAAALGISADLIGADDDFFNINGDSITAMRLVASARAEGYNLRVSDIFTNPRLSQLASKIQPKGIIAQSNIAIKPFELLGKPFEAEAIRLSVAAKCGLVDSSVIEDVFPCTPLQESMLAATIKNPTAFISMRLYRISPDSDLGKFQAAWETVVARNRILRTRLIDLEEHGINQAIIRSELSWDTYFSMQLFLESVGNETMGPGSPLTRWALIKEPKGNRLVWIIHHAIYDGWILPFIESEVMKVYLGQTLPLIQPDLRVLVKFLQQDTKSSLEFWAQELEGANESIVFPVLSTQHYEPDADTYIERTISVDHNSIPTGMNFSALMYGSWSLLVSRLTGNTKVAFGAIRTGRTAPVDGIDKIMGPTVTTVPVLVELDSSISVQDFMAQLWDKTVRMTPHEHIGIQAIQRINAACAAACSFQTVFIIQPPNLQVNCWHKSEDPVVMAELDETKVEGFPDQHAVLNQYGLCLEILPLNSSITVRASFDSNLIAKPQMERVINQWEHIIKQIFQKFSRTPQVPLDDLHSLSQQDLHHVWTRNKHFPVSIDDVLVHQTISKMVCSQPEALAIDSWDGRLTYSELENLSTFLSESLAMSNIGPGCFVPLIFEKSMWANVAMLAVSKAGGAFVPLDADHPEGRLRAIMQLLKTDIILCSARTRDRAARLASCALIVDASLKDKIRKRYQSRSLVSKTNGKQASQTNDLVYAVFTSGSTGSAKGLKISHKNLATAIYHQAGAQGFRIDSNTRSLDSSSYSFDACIFNFFYTLAHGGCICVPSEASLKGDMGTFMSDYRINWAQLVPSVARTINPESLVDLKTLILTGEALTRGDIDTWGGRVRLLNVYGPSECTILCSISPQIRSSDQAGNIGHGQGATLWLTEIGNPDRLAMVGETGEILVEGPIIGAGYLGPYEFPLVTDPPWLIAGTENSPGRQGTLFRTGDQARLDNDGNLIFIGRIGSEIKLRGQRLSLMELEDVFRRQDNSGLEVAADIIRIRQGEKGHDKQTLVLFVTDYLANHEDPGHAQNRLSEKLHALIPGLKTAFDDELPTYMHPEAFVPLSEIPKTSSGKTDRRHLKKVGEQIRLQQVIWINANIAKISSTPPSTKEEQILASLWAKVLGTSHASIVREDAFFMLGGDSLGVMRLITAAHEQNILLKAKDVFKNPRLAELAQTMILQRPMLKDAAQYKPYSLVNKSLDLIPFIEDCIAPTLGVAVDQIEDLLPVNGFQIDYMNNKEEPLGLQYAYLDIGPETSWPDLVKATRSVVQSFQSLRARFVTQGGKYYQVILRDAPLLVEELVSNQQITTFSNSFCPEDARKATVSDVYTKLTLVDTGSHLRRVILRLSHMQNDGWCTIRILKSIASFYNGESVEKTPDWARLLCFRQQVADESRTYWRALLEGTTQVTPPLIFQPGGSKVRTLRTFALPYFHSSDDNRRTRPTVVVNVAWALVLQQLAGHNDIVFGNVTTGRQGDFPGLDTVIGPCVNMLPMRLRLSFDSRIITRKQQLRKLVESSAQQMDERTAFEGLDWDDMVDHCTAWSSGMRYSSAVHFRNMAFEPKLVLGTQRVIVAWYELVAMPHWTTVLVYPEDDVLRLWLLANPEEIGDQGADEILQMLADYVDEIMLALKDEVV